MKFHRSHFPSFTLLITVNVTERNDVRGDVLTFIQDTCIRIEKSGTDGVNRFTVETSFPTQAFSPGHVYRRACRWKITGFIIFITPLKNARNR